MRRARIVGIGETEVGRLPKTSVRQLEAQAARSAMVDARIAPDEIDGLITCVPRAAPFVWHGNEVAEYIGLRPRFIRSFGQGGSAALLSLAEAAAAIKQGLANTVLVVAADKMLTGLGSGGAVTAMAETVYREFEVPYGPTVPAAFALLAQRHMFEFGTTEEQLASVAVSMRSHAAIHPKAQMRKPITIDDVLASRPIATPLHLLDCSLISDGGAAIILSSDSSNARAAGISLLGWGESHDPAMFTHQRGLTTIESCRHSANLAFAMAEVGRDDVDVLFVYDPFTISTVVAVEDLGYCGKGEGGSFVEGNAIRLNGALPINPHGGLLSYAHPGRPGAFLHIVEAVRQLRGEAEARQVPNARVALLTAEGAMLGAYATLIMGR